MVSILINMVVCVSVALFVVRIKSKRGLKSRQEFGHVQRSQDRASAQQLLMKNGKPYDVVLAMRVRNEGSTPLGRRWRQGTISYKQGPLMFFPYRPRKAKVFDLTDILIVGERASTVSEKWWFAGPTVLLGESPTLGPIEFGFGPGEWVELGRAMLTSRSSPA